MTLLKKRQAVDYLNSAGVKISASTYLRLIKSGTIKQFEDADGNATLVSQAELDRYIQGQLPDGVRVILIIDGVRPGSNTLSSDCCMKVSGDAYWSEMTDSVFPQLIQLSKSKNLRAVIAPVNVMLRTPHKLLALSEFCAELRTPFTLS